MTILTAQPPEFLKLLVHDIRWQLVSALAHSDYRVQELVAQLQRPQNLVSYHLRLLRAGHIVTERRSSADGRDVYYSLDIDQLRVMYLESGPALHPALACTERSTAPISPAGEIARESGETRPYRILFLCTHNSARSQMAEGFLRAAGGVQVEVFSAGNEATAVHPLAIRAAADWGVDISQQQAQNIAEFAGQSFDRIITVCDRVREVCPAFPNDPPTIHWSLPDPTAVTGTDDEQYQAFWAIAQQLSTRIDYLLWSLR